MTTHSLFSVPSSTTLLLPTPGSPQQASTIHFVVMGKKEGSKVLFRHFFVFCAPGMIEAPVHSIEVLSFMGKGTSIIPSPLFEIWASGGISR